MTVQPSPEARAILRHLCSRVPEYRVKGGVTRAISEAVVSHWGPLVAGGRRRYLARKIREAGA